MIRKVAGTLLFLCFFSWYARPQSSRVPSRGEGQYQIRFNQDLGFREDLRLSGNAASASVRFFCEAQWKPVAGSRLHLFVDHSPDLDGDRSFVSVSLNYGVLRSLRLDSQNANNAEILIPLPPELLKPRNELRFSVTQHVRSGSSTRPWTAIKAASSIVVQYEETAPQLDLSLFPSPFIDPHSYRPKRIALLVPEIAESPTLEANALLVANLCSRAGAQPVQVSLVRAVQNARDPLLIVGTPWEQPELGLEEMETGLKVEMRSERRFLTLSDGALLDESEGVIEIRRNSSTRIPVLVVTANSSAGVLKGVRALLAHPAQLSGRSMRVVQEQALSPKKSRDWRGFIPPDNRFTLADLDLTAERRSIESGQAFRLPLRAPPDARFLEYGHRITLRLQLLPLSNLSASALEVYLNATLLGRHAAADIFRGTRATLSLDVPAQLLRGDNTLELLWRPGPDSDDSGASLELLQDSEFYLPRDYRVELPNLALLQQHLFPFSLRADLSDTIVLLPDSVGPGLFGALIELARSLGERAPSERLAFRVKRQREVSDDLKRTASFVVLSADDATPKPDGFFGGWKPLPWIEKLKGTPTLQTWLSASNRQRSILLFRASSIAALSDAVALGFSDRILRQLEGDSAYLTARGPVCFRMAAPRRFQEFAYLTRLEAWMRMHWIALPVVLTLASGILFVGLRLALGHYRRSREAA